MRGPRIPTIQEDAAAAKAGMDGVVDGWVSLVRDCHGENATDLEVWLGLQGSLSYTRMEELLISAITKLAVT